MVNYADEALKQRLLPKVASGEARIQAFGLTEPDAGSDSTAMRTRAKRDGGRSRVDGEGADLPSRGRRLPRLTGPDDAPRRGRETHRRCLDVLVDLDDALADGLETEPIPKTASNAVPAYQLHSDDVAVPAENRIGERVLGPPRPQPR